MFVMRFQRNLIGIYVFFLLRSSNRENTSQKNNENLLKTYVYALKSTEYLWIFIKLVRKT